MIQISKPNIGQEEIRAVNQVLASGMLSQGVVTEELEKKFAEYCGTKYAVAVNSGTAAIHAALFAMGIGKGDEVVTTPFTFIATISPIVMLGAKVVFADIGENDFNIDPKEIEKKITNKTKAIVPVDLYGKTADYENIEAVASKNNLKILEDACQAVGAVRSGRKTGSFGNASAFSFYATKNIMCGEGGIITTNEKETYEQCRVFRHHGESLQKKGEYKNIGYNYRTTDLLASIALEQLKKVDEFNRKRRENAFLLSEGLKDIKGISVPGVTSSPEHVYNLFTIRVLEDFKTTREKLRDFLEEKGIKCGIYYSTPLHLQPAFKNLGYKKGDFPIAEKLANEVLSLPVHPLLSKNDIKYIIQTIRGYEK